MKKMVAILAMLVAVAMPALAAWDWYALGVPEMAANGGATHVAIFEYRDFTATNTATAEHFTNSIPAKRAVEFVMLKLDTAFERTSATTSSVSLKIGDGSDDDLFLTATELASDGTEVYVKYGPPFSSTVTVTPALQTANALTALTAQTANFATAAAGQTENFGTALTVQTTAISYLSDPSTTQTVSVVTNVLLTTAAAWTNATLTTAAGWTNYVGTTAAVATNVTATATATAGELGRKLYSAAGNLVFTFTPNTTEAEALDDMTAGQVRLYFRVLESQN